MVWFFRENEGWCARREVPRTPPLVFSVLILRLGEEARLESDGWTRSLHYVDMCQSFSANRGEMQVKAIVFRLRTQTHLAHLDGATCLGED